MWAPRCSSERTYDAGPVRIAASTADRSASTLSVPDRRRTGQARNSSHASCLARLRPGMSPTSYCAAQAMKASSTRPSCRSSRTLRRSTRSAAGACRKTTRLNASSKSTPHPSIEPETTKRRVLYNRSRSSAARSVASRFSLNGGSVGNQNRSSASTKPASRVTATARPSVVVPEPEAPVTRMRIDAPAASVRLTISGSLSQRYRGAAGRIKTAEGAERRLAKGEGWS